MRFSIRDLLYCMVIVAIVLAWWKDRQLLVAENRIMHKSNNSLREQLWQRQLAVEQAKYIDQMVLKMKDAMSTTPAPIRKKAAELQERLQEPFEGVER